MLLGNPHFPWRGHFRFTQQHLTIHGKYDVAGASLVGSPAVNIGTNKDGAWSPPVYKAYRVTPYAYFTNTATKMFHRSKGRTPLDSSSRTVAGDVGKEGVIKLKNQ